MRRRVLLVLISVVVLAGSGGAAVILLDNRVEGSPRETAALYLKSWAGTDRTAMRALVADPPADFATVQRKFADELHITSIKLTPGKITQHGENAADMAFTGIRQVRDLGGWPFASTLHMAVRDGAWKVIWSPATLHPDLAGNGRIELVETAARAVRLTTRDGEDFPKNNGAESYLADLAGRVSGFVGGAPSGWSIESSAPGRTPRRLVEFRSPGTGRAVKTTIDWFTQAAAARALDGVRSPAAIVAVRPSTGEVLAVADRLRGGRDAFLGRYPPGSTFEVVTAAALLAKGVTADSRQDCPPTYQIPRGRKFRNDETRGHGQVSLSQAFALSCDTTFVRLTIERLGDGELWQQAARLGFGARLAPGTGATRCVIQRTVAAAPGDPGGDLLGADAIGQGSVEASPLCMALVAGAVESGTWRSPRLLSENLTTKIGGAQKRPMPMVAGVAEALRGMMRTVVTDGTAVSAGLPPEVAGKTGTAEVAGGRTHAWFIGYRGDLAFCVFVENGGTGAGAAAPIAARFLKAL
ncbi:MAG TPA: penicillin-binding transpeptidase domain-containing protein [Thermopolyspora sp.]